MKHEIERLRREVARGAGVAAAKRLAWLLERQEETGSSRKHRDLNIHGCVFVCVYDARVDNLMLGAGCTAIGTLSHLRSFLERVSQHRSADIDPVIEWAKGAPPGATSSCGEVLWIFAVDLNADETLDLVDYEAWSRSSGRG